MTTQELVVLEGETETDAFMRMIHPSWIPTLEYQRQKNLVKLKFEKTCQEICTVLENIPNKVKTGNDLLETISTIHQQTQNNVNLQITIRPYFVKKVSWAIPSKKYPGKNSLVCW